MHTPWVSGMSTVIAAPNLYTQHSEIFFKRGVIPWSFHSECSGCHTVLTVALCGLSEISQRVFWSLLCRPLHSRLCNIPNLSVAVCIGLSA